MLTSRIERHAYKASALPAELHRRGPRAGQGHVIPARVPVRGSSGLRAPSSRRGAVSSISVLDRSAPSTSPRSTPAATLFRAGARGALDGSLGNHSPAIGVPLGAASTHQRTALPPRRARCRFCLGQFCHRGVSHNCLLSVRRRALADNRGLAEAARGYRSAGDYSRSPSCRRRAVARLAAHPGSVGGLFRGRADEEHNLLGRPGDGIVDVP